MKSKNMLYEAKEFNNLREVLQNTAKEYPNNIAFIIKNKEGKETTYTNITYTPMVMQGHYLKYLHRSIASISRLIIPSL